MSIKQIELSASKIRAYKACPRLYELQYIEGLKPLVTPEALETGTSYHACVENILKGEPYEGDGITGPMARAFETYIPWQKWGIEEIEKPFEIDMGYGKYLRGRIDAVCKDGTPIEHKTTRNAIDEKYIDNLAWDDQVSIYLYAMSVLLGHPVNRVIYTVCQKPTIRQKKNQTTEEYYEEVSGWYDESRIKTFEVVRSVDELKETEEEIKYVANCIRNKKIFYRNPAHCQIMGCTYRSVCLNYDPECLVEFQRGESKCRF